MKTYAVTIPEIAIVGATRGVAGAGIGLLVAGLLRPDTRRILGWTLLTLGALSTIPIAMALFGKRQIKEETNEKAKEETKALGSPNSEAVWHREVS